MDTAITESGASVQSLVPRRPSMLLEEKSTDYTMEELEDKFREFGEQGQKLAQATQFAKRHQYEECKCGAQDVLGTMQRAVEWLERAKVDLQSRSTAGEKQVTSQPPTHFQACQ